MASALHWIPDSLYNYSISAVVSYHPIYIKDVPCLPNNVLFDVCYKMYKQGLLSELRLLFSDLKNFIRLLAVKEKQFLLHHCFQALVDHGSGITEHLALTYKSLSVCAASNKENVDKENAIQIGLSLGCFLSDAGWFLQSETILTNCLLLCKAIENEKRTELCLDCYQHLLHVRNGFCKFHAAERTYNEALTFIAEMHSKGKHCNLAGLYAEFARLFFARSHYNEAYKWSIEALKEVGTCTLPKVIITVIRQAAKVCVLKREFGRASLLIKQALHLSRECFGSRHPVMADFLIDYGFYLLNVDSIHHSLKVYQTALETRQYIFGGTNLLVAIAHEDLAYALYVHEYSAGKFKDAREHAEKAMQIMTRILPDNHLLLASSKRVKALILEEIAIDNYDYDNTAKRRLFLESQELHLSALHLNQEAFGEMNVQTAKHYGNLGRLYQSMHRFEESKEMHLKAIKIKEQMLGPSDYEVALSSGHLASLYNYDMQEFDKAEALYLRSINIAIKLFGESCSGLEYDYRGLLRIYEAQGNARKANKYREMLYLWKRLRDKTAEAQNGISPLTVDFEPIALDQIYSEFLLSV